jgi:hypothetical protein
MARGPALLAVIMALGAACLPTPTELVRVDMPGVRILPSGSFREVVVANFRDDSPSPGFDLGGELQRFLAPEIDRVFDGAVSRVTVSWDRDPSLSDPAFWKRVVPGREGAVILAGAASLVGRTRKALQKTAAPVDGPFKVADRPLLEYRHYALVVDLAVISAETGEPLFRRTFREEKDYIDIEKPAEFAFSELADRVRAALFPILFGTTTIEDRTLLRR